MHAREGLGQVAAVLQAAAQGVHHARPPASARTIGDACRPRRAWPAARAASAIAQQARAVAGSSAPQRARAGASASSSSWRSQSPPPRSTQVLGVAWSGGRRPRCGNGTSTLPTPAAHSSASGQRAGAADHQVGPGVGRGHVGDEGLDATRRRRPRRRRAAASSRMLLAALVAHFERDARRAARPAPCGTAALSARAPWLPPSTSRRSGAVAAGEALAGGGSAAISARTGLPTVSSATPGKLSGKPRQHAPREPRQHAVGHARRAVLFVHDQRPAQQPARPARRARRRNRRS